MQVILKSKENYQIKGYDMNDMVEWKLFKPVEGRVQTMESSLNIFLEGKNKDEVSTGLKQRTQQK